MADMIEPAQNSGDEIDLILVLERTLGFLTRYKKELLTAAFAGLLSGAAIYSVLPKTYGSTLILHSQVLTNSEEIRIIDTWNGLRKNHEYGILSRNLNTEIGILSKVKLLTAENIANTQAVGGSGFTVDVLVTDTSILPNLQRAIIYGLENNEYVAEKVRFRKDNTTKMIENINREIAKLDSTKKKIESSSIGRTNASSSFIVDISDVNVQMINLNEKLYQYQESLKFVDAIQVLQNFEKFEKPASPRLSVMIFSGFLGGLFLGFSLALLKYLRLKIAALRRSRPSGYSNKGLPV